MTDESAPVKALLETVFGASRTVYLDEAPDGDLPDRYVIAALSVGESEAAWCGAVESRTPTLFVTSVARGVDAESAAREAKWASRKAVDALVSWRASIGQASWLPEHVVSSRPQRDTDAEGVVVYVSDQFVLRYQP